MKEKQNEGIASNSRYLWVFAGICVVIIVIAGLYYWSVNNHYTKADDAGTFGDSFGGLTALFTGFAFAGVIITIVMQMKELELTREELKKSVAAQDKTQTALNLQLRHMQSTTRIESVKNIIDSYTERDENDKKIVAKTILEKLTEEIFYDKAFVDIVTPVLVIRRHSQLRNKIPGGKYEDYDESKNNQMEILFANSGPSFLIAAEIVSSTANTPSIGYNKVVESKRPGGGGTQTNYDRLSDGNLVERDSLLQITVGKITKEEVIEIVLKYTGAFVAHEFDQKLVITRKGSKVTCDLQKISLIKLSDQATAE